MKAWTVVAMALAAAGAFAGETIMVADGETFELNVGDVRVTNVTDTVITLGAGSTLKILEPSETDAGFAVYARSSGSMALTDWPLLTDADPISKFSWDLFFGTSTNLYSDERFETEAIGYVELNSARWYIPEAGTYSFYMNVDDFGFLMIDGVPLLASTTYCQEIATNGVELAAGWHDVQILFGNAGSSFGPVEGVAPAFAYSASNAELTSDNVATEGTRLIDTGDGSVLQPLYLSGERPHNPIFGKVIMEGAATIDTTSTSIETLRWVNGGLRTHGYALTVAGAKSIEFGSKSTNSYSINYPVFDVADASFTASGAVGFILTNLVTACALPPASSCGVSVAAGTDLAVHGTNTIERLYTDGALDLSSWSLYLIANTVVPQDVPIRVGAGCQLRVKPCDWADEWTWYGAMKVSFTNNVELLDATASLRFSVLGRVYFHGSLTGVGDVIQDGNDFLGFYAAASQTGTVSLKDGSSCIFYQNDLGSPSNTLSLAKDAAFAFEPEGAGTQATTVRIGSLVGAAQSSAVNARSMQTIEIVDVTGYVLLGGASDGTSAYVIDSAYSAGIFTKPGVTCTLREVVGDDVAVRPLASESNGSLYSASLELANPSGALKWVNVDKGRELVLSGTGTVNQIIGSGILRLAEGADVSVHDFDETVHVAAGGGKLTVLEPSAGWRDKVLLWLDPTDSSTISALTDKNGVEQTYTNGYRLVEAWYDKRAEQRTLFALNNRKWSLNRYDLQPQVYPYLVTSGGPNGLPYFSFGTYQQSVAGVGLGGKTTTEARRLQLWRGEVYTNNTSSGRADAYATAKVAWAVMVFGSQMGGGAAILGTDSEKFSRAGQTTASPISSKSFTLYVDGVESDPRTSYFNGGWQLLSFDVSGTNVNAIAWNNKFQNSGGQNYGEIILFGSTPTDTERKACEAYLATKWGLASSVYYGDGAGVSFAGGSGDVVLSEGVDVVARGNFSGTVTLSGGTLSVGASALPLDEGSIPSDGRVAWYDPNVEGALAMSTMSERPLCVRALVERDNDGLALGTSYLLGTIGNSVDRRPWLSTGSRGGSATNWLDFSNIYDSHGNTLRRRTGTPPSGESGSTSNVKSVDVRTAFVALDSANGGGMPLIDSVGATEKIKPREPTTDISTPVWSNATTTAVTEGTTRLDGVEIAGTSDGYTGWPEVLSVETTNTVAINYFGYYGYDQKATPNAEILGEILLYDTLLDDDTRAGIEAYMMQKWTGRLPEGFVDLRSAKVKGRGTVRVPTVAVMPSFEDFSGTGVVAQADFAFTLDSSATPAVAGALEMPCALTLPASCTATVTCATKPRAGTYMLVSASEFTRDTAWTLSVAGDKGASTYAIRVTDTAVFLDVISPGAVVIIR